MYNNNMAFINDILSKNLSYIKRYDNDLCNRLASICEVSPFIQLIYTEKKEANLAIYDKPINEQAGAQAEATRLVNSLTHNNNSSIHVVMGMGFGYIFSSLVDVSKGKIILYEPNIELLRIALEMVDMSEYLSKNNVFITDNLDILEKHFGNCFVPSSKTAILGCDYYRRYKTEGLNDLIKKLSRLQGIYEANAKQRAKDGAFFTSHVCLNLHKLSKSLPITHFKNSLLNKPAIIAAAGPSLGENLDIIKKYRNKFVLFGVSSSFGSLLNNDIFPDFVSIIEKFDSSGLIKDLPLENISLIAEPYTNLNVLNLPFKQNIITSSFENSANEIYNKMFDLDDFYFETKGTVAYNALYSAMYMGCNPIILVGQDLAYVDGECYSKNSPLSAYKCRKTSKGWEVYITDMEQLIKKLYPRAAIDDNNIHEILNKRAQSLTAQLIGAKTKLGEDIATSITFSLFAEYYKSFAKEHSKKIKLYNTSKKGIDIGDYEYKPLDEILKELPDINVQFKDSNNYPDVKLNVQLFENEIYSMREVFAKLTEARESFLLLCKKTEENNNLNDILPIIKNLLSIYLTINNEYTNKSIIYRETTIASAMAFSDIKNYLESNITDNIKDVIDILSIFYEKDYFFIERVLKCLECVRRRFKYEGSTTKS